jgi:hypothetical protein
LTAGRWVWVEGKRWREILGERMSGGRGWARMFGRRGERVRRAVLRQTSTELEACQL